MNATEARTNAAAANSLKISNEFLRIQNEISIAVGEGRFEVDIFDGITKENMNYLRDEGFNVKTFPSGMNEISTHISW